MTTRIELQALVDLAERLHLVYERDDEYPMRVLGEQLREELLRLHGQLENRELHMCSLLDPSSCDSTDLRSRTRCLIDAAREWQSNGFGSGTAAAGR